MTMPITRRAFINKLAACCSASIAVSAGWLYPFAAPAVPAKPPFAPGKLADTLNALFADRPITDSDQIDIKIPKIAENGAVVPITVSTGLADVRSIHILVEKNPVPLAARFTLAPDMDAMVSARLKMAETCDVIVIADTGRALYRAASLVKVTIGGCGG